MNQNDVAYVGLCALGVLALFLMCVLIASEN
jgi:hypothetical protein